MSTRIGLPPPPYGSNISRERRVMWCAQETRELIRLAGRLFSTNSNCRKHSKEVYQAISDEMKKRGHHKSLEQCRIKWKHLKGFYFEALQKETEADQLLICPFFKDLQPILRNTKKGAARGAVSANCNGAAKGAVSSNCNIQSKNKRNQSVSSKMPVFQTVLIDEKKTDKVEANDNQKFVIVQDPLGMLKRPVVLKPQGTTSSGTPLNITLSNNQNGLWQQVLLTVPQQKGGSQPTQIKSLVVTPQDPLSVPKNNVKAVSTPSPSTPPQVSLAPSPTPSSAQVTAPPSIQVASLPAVPPPISPEVCLRWDSYNNNMRNMFPALLSNERFVDVTLACEGRSVKCHKFMLSACSPYFDKLLGDNPCRHPIVLLKDLQFWEVQAILDFIYKGEVRVRQNKLPMLLAAANCLQIKGLSETTVSSPSMSENSDQNSSTSSINLASHSGLKLGKKRKSRHMCSSDSKESTSVDDSDSEISEDEQSRLIVVGNNIDEADSTSAGIPTTNGTIIKKIKLETPSASSNCETKDGEESLVEPRKSGTSVKKKSGNPPNLIKIEHPQLIPKTEDLSYESEWKDDGSSSPSYYPAYPEAIVDTVLIEEDSSNQ